jgi:RsmE family RNA methyltransferase
MNLVLLQSEDVVERDGSSGRAVLTGRRIEHLRRVHRAAPGRELRVGLLGGMLGRGTVEAIDEASASLRFTLDQPPPAKLPLTLLLALPRPKTLRRMLQTAATMGVPRVVLFNSWRVDKSYWKSPQLAPDAIAEQLRLGLEQGGDTVPPEVSVERLLVPFARDRLDGLADGSARLLAHPGAATACPAQVGGPLTLALGPEGGFIAGEVALFERHGFTPIALGPRLLRVEQALPALIGRLA